MILTSNRGFAEWGEVFGDPVVATALLDRLLHHAVVIQIEGSSYRLRQHADLMPEHVRSKALINAANPGTAAATPRPTAQRMEPPITLPADHRTCSLGNFTSALLGKFQSALTVPDPDIDPIALARELGVLNSAVMDWSGHAGAAAADGIGVGPVRARCQGPPPSVFARRLVVQLLSPSGAPLQPLPRTRSNTTRSLPPTDRCGSRCDLLIRMK